MASASDYKPGAYSGWQVLPCLALLTACAAAVPSIPLPAAAAFREVAHIDSLLSHYKEDSEVSILNREKKLEKISGDLSTNLKQVLFFGELTAGAFDTAVQPVLELYEHTFEELERSPTEAEIEQVLRSVDYRQIEFNGESVSIGADQKIILEGIAKGYAVDRPLTVLQAHGIRNTVVDAGGETGTIRQVR